MLKQVKYRLTEDDNVLDALNWKLSKIQADNLPISSITDYIYNGLNSLDTEAEQIDNYIAELKERKATLKAKKQKISEGVATFFIANGVEKLDGSVISSITLTAPKEATKKVKQVFKTELSKDEINAFLASNGKGEFIEDTEDVEAKPATIRINKKRG